MKESVREHSEEEFMGKYVDSDREDRPAKQGLKQKRRRANAIKMNVSDTQYPVVKFVGKKLLKWQLQYSPIEDLNFDLCWTDNAVKPELLAKMQQHQKINHFPGMYILSRKNNLGRNLMKLRKFDPEEYNFFPHTFVLPGDYVELKQYHQNRKPGKAQTFIVKPEASCQGRGIYLTRNIEKIKHGERCVVQRYLHKPFLIDNLKFDLRIYVLVTGVDPLRIYVFEEGLARFATEPYVAPRTDNLEEVCMHLTNYAINKDSPNFIFNESTKEMNVGHKRSLTSVYEYLAKEGYDVETLKQRINDMFIKAFISGHPVLSSTYRSCQPNNFANNMCFQLLGFDVILDSKFNPILLQVNYTPSFSTDTPLDSLIKKNAIRDTLNMINMTEKFRQETKAKKDRQVQERITTGKRKKYTDIQRQVLIREAQAQRDAMEDQNTGGFKKIYPLNQDQVKKYKRFFQFSHQMQGLIYGNGTATTFGTSSTSSIIPIEKKAQLQKQLMKTYQLQPNQSLRKNSSTKITAKNREAVSSTKSKHNYSSDKLFVEPAYQPKKQLERPQSKSKKQTIDKHLQLQSDSITQEVYLFSNDTLKDIAMAPKQEKPKKCFSRKKQAGSYYKQ